MRFEWFVIHTRFTSRSRKLYAHKYGTNVPLVLPSIWKNDRSNNRRRFHIHFSSVLQQCVYLSFVLQNL